MVVEDRTERNLLRHIVMKAEDEEILSKEEVGFIITLVEKFRAEVERKTKQLYVLQGEIAQLKLNERLIIQLVENIIAADERAKSRRETMERLKGLKENESNDVVEEQKEQPEKKKSNKK